MPSDEIDPDELEALKSVFDSIVEVYKEYDYKPPQIRAEIENGIYERARLEGPAGAVFTLSSVYFWSTNFNGRHLVDVYEDEIPDGVRLTDCRLQIDSDDGVPLLGGPVVDVGRRDGLGGATTVVVGCDPPEVGDDAE